MIRDGANPMPQIGLGVTFLCIRLACACLNNSSQLANAYNFYAYDWHAYKILVHMISVRRTIANVLSYTRARYDGNNILMSLTRTLINADTPYEMHAQASYLDLTS